jgi:LysR family transcriptional activator of nhaA
MKARPRTLRVLDLTQLDYLRHIAREGSVAGAATALNVTPQTISGQVQVLEDRLGQALLERVGRGVRLTERGRLVLEYAADMLTRGEDLLRVLETASPDTAVFRVGLHELIPKLVTHRLLAAVLALPTPPQLECREGPEERLFEDLAARRLDAVIATGPAPAGQGLESTLLAESGVAAFGAPALARRYRRKFPASLNGAPLLVSTADSGPRRLLDGWLTAQGVTPKIVGAFEDAALREAFGAAGAGLFLAPELMTEDLRAMYRVERVGPLPGLVARYFLSVPVRTRRPPAETAIRAAAPHRGK